MGASVTNITALLTADFLKLVVIAILIASPLAWVAMNKWLSDFAYRITVSWWLIALTKRRRNCSSPGVGQLSNTQSSAY